MKIVVVGGSGLTGSKVVNRLRSDGHEVLAALPASGVNTITGEGLDEDTLCHRSFHAILRVPRLHRAIGRAGDVVNMSPALIQPIASDDIAAAVADYALGSPLNAVVEVSGPERGPAICAGSCRASQLSWSATHRATTLSGSLTAGGILGELERRDRLDVCPGL